MRTLITAVFSMAAIAAAAAAPSGTSAGAGKELAAFLSAHNQSAIACRDADGGFVAALYYPGVQLLVVSGRPAGTDAVEAQLAAKNYQYVYAALQDRAAETGRLFVQDLGADGLADGGDSVDVAYQEGRQILFDGNPRSHKMSDKEYREAFSQIDERYARMLTALLAEAKRAAGGS